ncbi:hypothetical protein SAMN02745687_02125 [Lachnospiraceae bacterium NK3A20]|nr:hypothetical protein SAMN02745687_02125 [Lachnospiraceae bacterium NK3A20]
MEHRMRTMVTMEEVREELGVSTAKAYQIIRQLNHEMEQKGFHTVRGKVSRKYFEESFYGVAEGR